MGCVCSSTMTHLSTCLWPKRTEMKNMNQMRVKSLKRGWKWNGTELSVKLLSEIERRAQVTSSLSDPLYSFVLCGGVKVKHRQQVWRLLRITHQAGGCPEKWSRIIKLKWESLVCRKEPGWKPGNPPAGLNPKYCTWTQPSENIIFWPQVQ